MQQMLNLQFTRDELNYISDELNAILRANERKNSGDMLQYDPQLVYFTEIPHAIEAIKKLTREFRQLTHEKNDVSIEVSHEESSALKEVMYSLLMEFNTTSYKHRKFTNPIMALAFGKVYNAVSEEEHPHLRKEHFNTMLQNHIDGMKSLGYSPAHIAEFEALLKT